MTVRRHPCPPIPSLHDVLMNLPIAGMKHLAGHSIIFTGFYHRQHGRPGNPILPRQGANALFGGVSADSSCVEQAARVYFGESRAAPDEASGPHCGQAKAPQVSFLRWRNQSRPREPHQSRFPSDGSQRKVAHGYIGIPYPCRKGLPVADDRLFRWHGRQLVDWHKS